jgi:diadenosine tetraphosphate (Ap4A) HIT family hydrolase
MNQRHAPSSVEKPSECEFCGELAHEEAGRFLQAYSAFRSDRVLLESRSFVIWPSLGALTIGHVLVLPKEHVEAMAHLNRRQRDELAGLLQEATATIAPSGPYAAFEHGACSRKGGGCGIYHGHLHLLPLPAAVPLDDAFTESYEVADDLDGALAALHGVSDYLLFQADGGKAGYVNLEGAPTRFQSQHFRRLLNDRFGFLPDWNWRWAAEGIESNLLATMDLFGVQARTA